MQVWYNNLVTIEKTNVKRENEPLTQELVKLKLTAQQGKSCGWRAKLVSEQGGLPNVSWERGTPLPHLHRPLKPSLEQGYCSL